jgi:hypothetical protein
MLILALTYLASVDQQPEHTSALRDRDILNMNFLALPPGYRLIKTVIQLWERTVALLVAECVYVRMLICVEDKVWRLVGNPPALPRLSP